MIFYKLLKIIKVYKKHFYNSYASFTSKMKLNVFKNKKTGQMTVFLKKKDLKLIGIKDPVAVRLSKKSFMVKNNGDKITKN